MTLNWLVRHCQTRLHYCIYTRTRMRRLKTAEGQWPVTYSSQVIWIRSVVGEGTGRRPSWGVRGLDSHCPRSGVRGQDAVFAVVLCFVPSYLVLSDTNMRITCAKIRPAKKKRKEKYLHGRVLQWRHKLVCQPGCKTRGSGSVVEPKPRKMNTCFIHSHKLLGHMTYNHRQTAVILFYFRISFVNVQCYRVKTSFVDMF